ncbi:histidine kinase dimerization/phospho-acceptor domain-containing protein [Nocardioides sp. C4-1]|uniref:histidine kinase dimerization/phospho-acceptor domain-containing protein n=1 Tax=Nocardioides sp. C4-1 TaxID=3151851 RepID=UPI003265DB92
MRERLTASFVAITLLLLLGAGLVRAYAGAGDARTEESRDAAATAAALAIIVADRVADGEPVGAEVLAPYAGPRVQLTYATPGADPVVAVGPDFAGGDADDEVVATVTVGDGTLTVSRRDAAEDGPFGARWPELLALFALLACLAGLLGYVVARSLSAPFRQLAVAAAALGRGRFDLDLPRGGVPEARAIASALEQSASQLRDRLERERQFGQHTSHVLRTPLTSLRLRLEVLIDDPGLSPDAREAATACLKAVGQLNDVAGELVELGGRGVLVAGAAVPLRDLATQVAQRWADALDDDGRRLTAAVEGDIELLFTPGPVEQVLDLIFDDIIVRERGAVRLVFEGAASRLRVDLLCAGRDGVLGAPRQVPHARVRTMLDAVGGSLERPADADVLRLHLPRR